MERLAQYWDDLDDLFWALASSGERLRHVGRFAWRLSITLLIASTGVLAALVDPVAGLATASLLVLLLTQRAIAVFALKNDV